MIGNTMKPNRGLRLSSIPNLLHVAAATKVHNHPRGPTCCRWQDEEKLPSYGKGATPFIVQLLGEDEELTRDWGCK